MATLLFHLNNVPEDEADDVRQLLTDKNLDFYETHAGFFGLGVAAIWLHNDEQLPVARAIIDEYQAQRAVIQREHYDTLRANGEIPGFGGFILQHPFRFSIILVLILFVLTLTLMPFWQGL
ncbi:hypothetical protein Q7C_1741 [Methylophaga frappieri]|uniref:DUF2007 domain-containing protein n=1 Tax=Methylophaga frappieri (strain ATCC BAA-2434 / DSM 25690 / JAM7) TaxID=754477 RepID=I1YIY9_METFJ|nr:DUF6164 family protein [Methylophaga frappieri]AFJ02882.1 hypothetical protein Q7C_1741 [Methylophaga frappieri]